jgi:hypothetical protein
MLCKLQEMQGRMSQESTIARTYPITTDRSATAIIVAFAAAAVLAHWLWGNRYGFQRDELQTLDDARHLAWGYVAYPSMTPLFGRLSLALFGTSLRGFRFFASLALAAALLISGLMARQLRGRRGAQLLTAFALMPAAIGAGMLMQYVAFDYLCWVLTAYFVVRLLTSGDPRWWLAIGSAIGCGMEAKYTMGFFALGVAAGTLLTDARSYLRSKWLWMGVAVSILLFLPNLAWQARHGFVSFDFLSHIHARDVRLGRTKDFLPFQLKMTLLAAPLWIAGLWFCLFSRDGKRFRLLGWMYVVPLLLFVAAKGRGYYLQPAYPVLYAAGAVWGERRIQYLSRTWKGIVRGAVWLALAADIVLVSALFLPIAPIGSPWFHWASGINGDLREEIGWPELVREVARIRDSLPAQDRAHLGILGTNYGEAGAVNLYGPEYGLPRAISGVNSFWHRGYGDPPPQVLIVLGLPEREMERHFQSCELAGHTPHIDDVRNEETEDHPDIFVCRGVKESWPDFWKDFHYYG